MGYTTDFRGSFKINKPVDQSTFELLRGLAETRRMKRNLEGYGVEGEFYVADDNNNVIDHNCPPSTQPGLWCQWLIDDDCQTIEWDGGEKFYNYVEWIKYLINSVLAPRGYYVHGSIEWRGEDWSDTGTIQVLNNTVNVE